VPADADFVGPRWGEAKLLRIAHAYEEATPALRGRRPPE
jgi:Asp-tRNA(Asn)/Glu-tRNA(Gln) amidotransferase A subunit family amidase